VNLGVRNGFQEMSPEIAYKAKVCCSEKKRKPKAILTFVSPPPHQQNVFLPSSRRFFIGWFDGIVDTGSGSCGSDMYAHEIHAYKRHAHKICTWATLPCKSKTTDLRKPPKDF
jgi:hypothetical protein